MDRTSEKSRRSVAFEGFRTATAHPSEIESTEERQRKEGSITQLIELASFLKADELDLSVDQLRQDLLRAYTYSGKVFISSRFFSYGPEARLIQFPTTQKQRQYTEAEYAIIESPYNRLREISDFFMIDIMKQPINIRRMTLEAYDIIRAARRRECRK